MGPYRSITIKKQVLLFEIERRCGFSDCNERNFTGLTKREALDYTGFECHVCKRWNDDSLTKKDAPDWWDEIQHKQVQAEP
ncbi:MAG TPA: hypothetical protein VKB46_22600 [Pyrinomonadaceae bacterium]|nr:hypothetical protein [Pyrinomonadaceae bacterium]